MLELVQSGGRIGEHRLRKILGNLVALRPPSEEPVDLLVMAAERNCYWRVHYILLAFAPQR